MPASGESTPGEACSRGCKWSDGSLPSVQIARTPTRNTVNIRTFQTGDEAIQAGLFNMAACALPGFKAATADDVKRRTRARAFDPTARFFAEEGGQVVGYCVLEPDQGRVSYPWCKKGYESVAPLLFEAVLSSARQRGVARLFAAYRRDWERIQRFLMDRGFAAAREIINYWSDPLDLPTLAHRTRTPIDRLKREDVPAIAEMGKGVIRLPIERLENYFFSNAYFPAESYLVLRDRDDVPIAVAIGLESASYADVRKVDPYAACFRLGAFGTEGLNTKRINGLFSFIVAEPVAAMTAGLALLLAANQEMTEGTVDAFAAQCPSDAPHLVAFYARYFKEHGRFPVLEKRLD